MPRDSDIVLLLLFSEWRISPGVGVNYRLLPGAVSGI